MDPLSIEFWRSEFARLWGALAVPMVDILLAGIGAGISATPPEMQAILSWDAVNTSVLRFLDDYKVEWIGGINATTQEQVVFAIDKWIKSGERLDSLTAMLTPIFGATRAEMIAVTEVTRLYAEGNILAWDGYGGFVSGKSWNTANDDLVCPICAPLNGKIVSLQGAWSADAEGNIVEGLGLYAPPAHPRCRCWLTPVLDYDALDQVFADLLRQ